MKRILLSLFAFAVMGIAAKVQAQCAGANVTVYNVQITGNGTIYTWSFNWAYNNGNASISVVYKCGGQVVGTAPCLEHLNNYPNGGTQTGMFDFGSCVGAKEVEIRIHASANCNGTYCLVGPELSPLPVKFSAVDAVRLNASNVAVKWTTSFESNNAGFAVERIVDGVWVQRGFVASQAANGNSDNMLVYSFSDLNNVRGISQYRVRQVDLDGKVSYSETRSVRGENQEDILTLYPNPSADGTVNIVFDNEPGARNVVVQDLSGQVLRHATRITNNNVIFRDLRPGLYIVRVSDPQTGSETTAKFLVSSL